MARSINSKTDRRTGYLDRRAGDERRDKIRHCVMDGDSRNNSPRRESDITKMMEEGKLWWSGL